MPVIKKPGNKVTAKNHDNDLLTIENADDHLRRVNYYCFLSFSYFALTERHFNTFLFLRFFTFLGNIYEPDRNLVVVGG